MSDMLVKLYDLPEDDGVKELFDRTGIVVRRAMAPEKNLVLNWVKDHFGDHWASECDVSFSNKPIGCYIAVKDREVVGFACYDATTKDFFGPTGVDENLRGQGIGKALLLSCLKSMKEVGYGYAIIGGVGPAEFYSKVAGATMIDNSTPGIYKGLL